MLRVFIILLLLSLLPNGQAAYKIYDFAGNGEQGFSRESGPALEMQLAAPRGLAIDKAGSVYFIDVENRRVRKVDIKTGIMTIVVGCDKKK